MNIENPSSAQAFLEPERKDEFLAQSKEEHHEAENETVDLSKFSKEELLKLLENYKVNENLAKSNAFLKQVRSHYDTIIEDERQRALQKFIENGGEEGSFEFKKDPTTQKFEKVYESQKDKITSLYTDLEKEKEKNLNEKNKLLEKLRALISSEENTTSIGALKEIQDQWKKIGPVPAAQNSTLWANYNALIERFYNNRSIYFELKELDRKKNLESKLEIVDKAEKLSGMENIIQAIKELKILHEEYKHIGPVPKDDQEKLWERFKKASDAIYDKRNDYFENLKKQQEGNFENKTKLTEQLEEVTKFQSDRIDDWKNKTTEVLALQEEWKKTGPVANDKAKDVSKRFWNACKLFFHNKGAFFKDLEQHKEENLKEKIALCEQAEALKDSEDLGSTAGQLKDLQKKWDSIGAVPIKEKEEVFKRFKAACDYFFNRKRQHFAETEKEYQGNLDRKNEICEEIEKLSDEPTQNVDRFKELQSEWPTVGFVPKADIRNIQDKYSKAVKKFLSALDQKGGGMKKSERLSLEVSALRSGPDANKKLFKKGGDIQRRIHGLKTEIDRYKTNMDFLAKSPKADALKKDIEHKIESAQNELKELDQQMKIIREG